MSGNGNSTVSYSRNKATIDPRNKLTIVRAENQVNRRERRAAKAMGIVPKTTTAASRSPQS